MKKTEINVALKKKIQTQKQFSVPVEPKLDDPCLAERWSKRAA